MNKTLTCIVCPMGCQLEIEIVDDEIKSVSGNSCKRGEGYALSEYTDPRRTVTSTVKTSQGNILPVKTDKPIPKNLIFECMNEINKLRPDAKEYHVGDVVLRNVLDTGVNIVVCANVRKR